MSQNKEELRIKKTCQPPERLAFNDWASEIRVSKIYDTQNFNDNLIYDEYLRSVRNKGINLDEKPKKLTFIGKLIEKFRFNEL